MPFRISVLRAGLLPLVLAIAAGSASAGGLHPVPKMQVGAQDAPIIQVQAVDPRVSALQEEVRRLTGLVEELNFQLLQTQDEIRRMKEDNEFRFQELEGKQTDAGSSAGSSSTQTAQTPDAGNTNPDAGGSATASAPSSTGEAPQTGEPPRTLGSITFDENGNIVAGDNEVPMDMLPDGEPSAEVAALPETSSPDELYRNSYEFILSGDYKTAEAGFRQYIDQYSGEEHEADAKFWLGEALLGQDRHREAAEVLLQASRAHPSANKAPEMLLKLGIALAAMNQRDVACATYSEIGQRYPQASDALKQRVEEERSFAGC
ncbi:tol-pal system protein YbgF [Nitratireductor basaltis]|uniref:Cell division coordinator CpoB n=1 Tax=Nitratireductor basaltis TaxID=472175 RepID=A0A084U799_9HYPH|nr:tol-pal system protein YbgF [Nitratireductor basaltis]KFB08835.1 Tetratricopeptide TPR_2 precursor [Nitratireductor basaltis]